MPRFFRYPSLKESLRGLLPWEMNITGVDIVHRHLADDITTSAAARPRIVTAKTKKEHAHGPDAASAELAEKRRLGNFPSNLARAYTRREKRRDVYLALHRVGSSKHRAHLIGGRILLGYVELAFIPK